MITSIRTTLGASFADRVESVDTKISEVLQSAIVDSDEESFTIQSQRLPAPDETLKLIAGVGSLHMACLRQNLADLRFASNMKHVGLAIHNYHATYGQLPRDVVDGNDKPLLSWRVAILPFLNEGELHDRFRKDEPWDSDYNVKLLEEMPDVFRNRDGHQTLKTSIQWVTGKGTAGSAKTFADIKDMGTTLGIVESSEPVQWTQPTDFVFDSVAPTAGLREQGSAAIMYDGSIAYLSPGTAPDVLRSAFMVNGHQVDLSVLDEGSPLPSRRSKPEAVQLGENEFLQTLSKLNSGDPRDVLNALDRLSTSLPDARSALVVRSATPLLRSESPLVRWKALRTIDVWKTPGVVDWKALAGLLDDRHEANRWLAIRILGEFPEPELCKAMLRLPAQDWQVFGPVLDNNYANIAVDSALPLLGDRDPSVRAYAASLVGAVGNDRHRVAVQKLLNDDNEMCREAAKVSLERLQKKGPLQQAVNEFDGDFVAAINKVAKDVFLDEHGDIVGIDLGFHNPELSLIHSDFPLLAKFPKLRSLDMTDARVTADGVAHLVGLPLEHLQIDYCHRLDDTISPSLKRLSSLKVLKLTETNIGDETLNALKTLRNLRELDLAKTRISDAGVLHLTNMHQLTTLDLSGNRISDAAISALAGKNQLRQLFLHDTWITDASIEHLSTLKSLEFLNLRRTRITEQGLARLKKVLPTCDVVN
ncbi:MAG: DUF1559 domain-containing protein [Pirellulaceae bacterium]